MNIKKGLARLFLLLWAVWLTVGLGANYREILTSLGMNYWSEELVVSRQIERCQDADPKLTECAFARFPIVADVVTAPQAKAGARLFIWFFVVAPVGIFLTSWLFSMGLGWVLRGFKP